jgi:hypothetical protein
MFQYAAGKSLALATGCRLKIDPSAFVDYKLHNGNELNIFTLWAETADPNEIFNLIGMQSKAKKFLMQSVGMKQKFHFIEKDFCYKQRFFRLKPPIYLDGYWQSYRYLQSCEADIRKEFTFKSELKGLDREIAERINGSDSVSVHVRRGDYLSNPTFKSVHGFIGIDYYYNAIHLVREKISSPHFFVF